MTSVSLDKLIDGLEEGSDSTFGFLDRESGEVYLISDEALSLSESEEDAPDTLPDWQKEEFELAQRVQSSDRYLALPSPRDVDEWNIMAEFSNQIKRDDIRVKFADSIRGSGAFRRFKQQIAHFGLWDEWNSFRHQAFGEFMREWCEENGITLAPSKEQSPGL
jgi:hypothetical protein